MNFIKHWFGIVRSVGASFLGVQSHSEYLKDADKPSFVPYIIVGVIMVFMFIISVWLLVKFLIASH